MTGAQPNVVRIAAEPAGDKETERAIKVERRREGGKRGREVWRGRIPGGPVNFLFFLLVCFSPSSHSQVHTAVSGPGGVGWGWGRLGWGASLSRAQMKEPPGAAPQVDLLKPLLWLSTAWRMKFQKSKNKKYNFFKKKAEREKGGVEVGKKNGGVSGRVGIWKQRLKDGRRKTGYG